MAKRIAIDARKFRDFGIGTYIRQIALQLHASPGDLDYVLLCRPADADELAALLPRFDRVTTAALPYSIGEQFRIPWRLLRTGADLLHEPHYVLPPLTRCRSVVTIHDCIHLMFPQYLPNSLAYYYARGAMFAATHQADRVLTVSEASKRDILRYYDIPPEKVQVIYNAMDERFLTPPDEATTDRVRQRYQLNHPFVLYVGNIKPHKNIERLVAAFSQARPLGPVGLKLVIVGDDLSNYPKLRQVVHRHQLDKHVRFLGYQPQETLASFYRLAGAFVFPSLYEGFGLPPLEAMACGTPVVTSNVSSLPEVAGDAALLVDPTDTDAIAHGIVQALTDSTVSARLREAGPRRAREFSWARSARQIAAVYREVLAR